MSNRCSSSISSGREFKNVEVTNYDLAISNDVYTRAREAKDRIYIIGKIRGSCHNCFYEKSSEKEECIIKNNSKNVVGQPKREDKSFYASVRVTFCRELCLRLVRLQRFFIFSSET